MSNSSTPSVVDTAAAVAIAIPADIAAPVVNNVSIINTASVVNTSVVLNTSSDDMALDNSPAVVNNVLVVNTDSVVDHSVVIHPNRPDGNAPACKPVPLDLGNTGLASNMASVSNALTSCDNLEITPATTPSTENKKGHTP